MFCFGMRVSATLFRCVSAFEYTHIYTCRICFVVFEFAACVGNHFVCMCVAVVNSPFVEYSTLTPSQRTHTKSEALSRTHTRPVGTFVCVGCVRVFWLHLLTFWRSTNCQKSNCTDRAQWKKARALLPVVNMVFFLFLLYCCCCCCCRCLFPLSIHLALCYFYQLLPRRCAGVAC